MNMPQNFMKSQWSDIMVQHSVYAGVVFLICAHPEVFKFVDKNLTMLVRQVDKGFKMDGNLLLFVHACVVAALMYFGTTFVFTPFTQMVQGFKNKAKAKAKPTKANNQRKPIRKSVGKPPSPIGASI